MASRNWIFGSLCLVIGFVAGHYGTRPASSTGRPAGGQSTPSVAGIPLAISAPPPVKEPESLKLTNVVFCSKITNFGNYATFPRNEFEPGQEVLIYAEIENLQSEQAEDGKYRTVVKSTMEIYRASSDGKAGEGKEGEEPELVERVLLPETIDLCHRRRLDYFHSYQFTLPDNLSAGDYIVKLIVQDEQSERQASRELAFSVK